MNLLRSPLIYLSKAPWARHAVTKWPIAWRTASRFVAGEHLNDAIRAIQALNAHGIYATLDHLGENITTPQEAHSAAEEIIQILDEIESSGVQAGVSIKLTQIGLGLSEALCEENLRCILEHAKERDNFVRIDMEDSPHVDATLRIFRKMCQGDFCDHIGIVIQAYLFRSEEDIRQLAGDRARVRLCKGAYKEPATIAFPQKSDVDANYDRLTRILVECTHEAGTPTNGRSGKVPPILAVASHDVKRINYAKACAQEAGLSKEQVEFQMLYGIRRDLQEQLVQEGYPVRVYVPYGSEWYPYVMRRLAERPANLWFFVSNFFRR